MTHSEPLMIAVAPNGARKTRQDYPSLPVTPAQLAHTAASCQEAGACMIHLHVRDDLQQHSLEPELYLQAIETIRREAGDELIIQITTEAVGIYQPSQQMQVVREVRPEAVSLAIRELCPSPAEETAAAEFFHWLHRERIAAQYILYDKEDIRRFSELQRRGIVPQSQADILLVLGRYTENQESDPDTLAPLLAEVSPNTRWWLCAFGCAESFCMEQAIVKGGHCRVGFENNTVLPDGSVATDNTELIALTVNNACSAGRSTASPGQARKLLGID